MLLFSVPNGHRPHQVWTRSWWLPVAVVFIVVVVTTTTAAAAEEAVAYNHPGCPTWPTADVWTSELGAALSPEAALHGPIPTDNYARDCLPLGTDAYAISAAGDGICMHAHACAYEFCRQDVSDFALPQYVVEAHVESDIIAALTFANQHDIQVAVKTTGHSYTGSSTARDSLLIWMHNYQKNGNITTKYQDSCGTKTYDAVIGIGGGETWNDVIEAVKDDYHVVTGGARTVSAAGGWLQGSGLSFSSRLYGLGVDQVVDFDVVLTNGTAVRADACTNHDLFWALRGGGGGTYGIVTHVHYQLHPVQSIVELTWLLQGMSYLIDNQKSDELFNFVELFLKFWIEKSPQLDNRWSGFFNGIGLHLLFFGSIEDAHSTFIDAMDDWYLNVLIPNTTMIEGTWGAYKPSDTITNYTSWYEYKGGAENYGKPEATEATGDAYSFVPEIFARLVPLDVVTNQPDELLEVLMALHEKGQFGAINYFLGGAINDVPVNETAVHPAMRKAIWSIIGTGLEGRDKLTEFLPNDVTGVCFNHHSGSEPDWRRASFGDNYDRLLEIKKKYDPDHRLNCWHCVGYTGDEFGETRTTELPCPTSTPSSGAKPSNPTSTPPAGSSSSLRRVPGIVLFLLSAYAMLLRY